MDDQLISDYVQAYDELQQYKKEVREMTKRRSEELAEMADALHQAMNDHGLDEVEYEGRTISVQSKIIVNK